MTILSFHVLTFLAIVVTVLTIVASIVWAFAVKHKHRRGHAGRGGSDED